VAARARGRAGAGDGAGVAAGLTCLFSAWELLAFADFPLPCFAMEEE
jgi:hypothetical protein